MWIISKASCFSLLIISFSVITIIRSWLYVLPDNFLYILYESPYFIPFYMCQSCARPCSEIGLGDVSGKYLPINHFHPLTNPPPVSLTPIISWINPTTSRMDALNPLHLPGKHYCIFFTARKIVSPLIPPWMRAAKPFKAARFWVQVPTSPLSNSVLIILRLNFPIWAWC